MEITPEMWEMLTRFGVNVAIAIIILIIGRVIAGICRGVTRKTVDRGRADENLSSFLGNLVYYLVIAFALIAAIDRVGIQAASFVAVLGAVGFAVGFALQGSLGNFASGVMLLTFRPFKAGDYVQAAGVGGTVKEVGILTTTLATPDNVKILIPNSQVFSNTIHNYSAYDTRRLELVIGIGYDSSIDKARELMQQLIEADGRILPDPAPAILVAELADSSVNFKVRVWVNSADYWAVNFELTEQIKKIFDENGIEIPFPQRVVHQIPASAG